MRNAFLHFFWPNRKGFFSGISYPAWYKILKLRTNSCNLQDADAVIRIHFWSNGRLTHPEYVLVSVLSIFKGISSYTKIFFSANYVKYTSITIFQQPVSVWTTFSQYNNIPTINFLLIEVSFSVIYDTTNFSSGKLKRWITNRYKSFHFR